MADTEINKPYVEAYWVLSETVLNLFLVITLYALLRLSYYTWKYDTKKTNIFMVFLTLVMLLVRLTSDQMVAFLGWQRDDLCLSSVSVSYAFYYVSAGVVFTFFWIQQNSFYAFPFLKHLVNKKLKFLSRLAVASLVTEGIFVVVLLSIPKINGWMFEATDTGCRNTNDQKYSEIFLLLVLAIKICGEVLLLGLLLYPLIKSKGRQTQTSVSYKPNRVSSPSPIFRRAVLGSYHESQQRQCSSSAVLSPKQVTTSPKTKLSCKQSINGIYNISETPIDLSAYYSQSDDEVFSESRLADVGLTRSNNSESEELVESPSDRKRKYFKLKSAKKPANSKHHKVIVSGNSVKQAIKFKVQMPTRKSKLRHRKLINSDLKRERKMHHHIRKIFLLASVCVVSDIIATIIEHSVLLPEFVNLIIRDASLVINATCLILSLEDGGNVLHPFCMQKRGIKKRRRMLSSLVDGDSPIIKSPTRLFSRNEYTKCFKNDSSSDNIQISSLSSAGTGSLDLS